MLRSISPYDSTYRSRMIESVSVEMCFSVTETHISTITDSIILLRYVEMCGEMRRGVTVLKMRGSMHDKDIREFTIDGRGMHVGKPFRNIAGILSGRFTYLAPGEIERMEGLFKDEGGSPSEG